MKNINPTYILIAIAVLAIGGFGFGVKSLINPTSEEDKAQDLRRRDLLKEFREILSAGYLQIIRKLGSLPMLNPANLREKALKINKAIGLFVDDEAAISAVFQSLKSKYEAFALAQTFNNLYNKDLFQTLAKNLNQNEITYLASIVDKLPIK